MSMNKKETAALAAALAKADASDAAFTTLKAAIAADAAPAGNLEVVLDFTDTDGTVVEACTLRIASLTRIKSGLGKRLAGILNVHSEAVYAHEDGDGTDGMTEEDAIALLMQSLSHRIKRCQNRFEEKPDKPVDKWASKAPTYQSKASNGTGSRGNSSQYVMGG
jgi:hypothetical protein